MTAVVKGRRKKERRWTRNTLFSYAGTGRRAAAGGSQEVLTRAGGARGEEEMTVDRRGTRGRCPRAKPTTPAVMTKPAARTATGRSFQPARSGCWARGSNSETPLWPWPAAAADTAGTELPGDWCALQPANSSVARTASKTTGAAGG